MIDRCHDTLFVVMAIQFVTLFFNLKRIDFWFSLDSGLKSPMKGTVRKCPQKWLCCGGGGGVLYYSCSFISDVWRVTRAAALTCPV